MQKIIILLLLSVVVSCVDFDQVFEPINELQKSVSKHISELCGTKAIVIISGGTNRLGDIGTIKEIGVELIGYSEPNCSDEEIKKNVVNHLNSKSIKPTYKVIIFPFTKLKKR